MGKDKKGAGGDKKSDKSANKKGGDAAGGSNGKVKAAQQINVRHILVDALSIPSRIHSKIIV